MKALAQAMEKRAAQAQAEKVKFTATLARLLTSKQIETVDRALVIANEWIQNKGSAESRDSKTLNNGILVLEKKLQKLKPNSEEEKVIQPLLISLQLAKLSRFLNCLEDELNNNTVTLTQQP